MKIVVKIGTQSILSELGLPSRKIMRSIVEQIAYLQRQGHKIVLVSSGAVGFGRQIVCGSLGAEYGASIAEKQVLASLGQHQLMHIYTQLFKAQNILTSQLLLTKQDFYTRRNYLNILRLITKILAHGNIIPIVNENDTVAIEELMFTDNDELAGFMAAQINADKLIILSHIKGVYTGNVQDPEAQVIPTISPEKNWPYVSDKISMRGRGGMLSKLSTARKVSRLGIETHIASAKQPGVITRLVMGGAGESIGTTVLASRRKSNIKRWIAYAAQQKAGIICVNKQLYELLQENRRPASILPIGIKSYHGDFIKGDVVEICGPKDQMVGVGIVRYNVNTLKEWIGQKNKPALIHYDYLHIF